MGDGNEKIKVGITIGDFNGIGVEVILKTFNDNRVFDYCTPIIYGSSHVITYHKKQLDLNKINHQVIKDKDFAVQPKSVGIVNCWDDEVIINLGQPSTKAGECALTAIDACLKDLQDGHLDVMVTAPVNKSTIKIDGKEFSGHTTYITEKCGVAESLMLLVGDRIKVGLVTEHVPLKDVAELITGKKIYTKLELLNGTLVKDFGINKPRIAVLSLNPHSGDNGALGKEEKSIIIPTLEKAQENGILAYGPYAADGFMGAGQYTKFDALLAMYHDQGLVAFKSISFGEGVNYTAGLPVIRTSPDHGTAYDIVGKNEANPDSFRQAIFLAIDIYKNRSDYTDITSNPLKRHKLKTSYK